MRQVNLVYVALPAVSVAAFAATYAAALPFRAHPQVAARSATRTAGAAATTARRAAGRPADDAPPVATAPPEPRVPRGLTTEIVAGLVQRTKRSGGVRVEHVTCVEGAPNSGRFGCAYTWRNDCVASLVDLSTGSLHFASERKLPLLLEQCTARNAFAPGR